MSEPPKYVSEKTNYGECSIRRAAESICRMYKKTINKEPENGSFPTTMGQVSRYSKRQAYRDCLHSMMAYGLITDYNLLLGTVVVNPIHENLPADTQIEIVFEEACDCSGCLKKTIHHTCGRLPDAEETEVILNNILV